MNRHERMINMVQGMRCTSCNGTGTQVEKMFADERHVKVECYMCGGSGTKNDGTFIMHCNKDDLVSMVMGTHPPMNQIGNPQLLKGGGYIGGHVDRWFWNHAKLKDMSIEELMSMYFTCKRK